MKASGHFPEVQAMVKFTAVIEQFQEQGEKTGWSYISIPREIAEQLKPGVKKSFRIKGKLDSHSISKVALLPMGQGNFILPLNAGMRKAVRKHKGARLQVQIQEDKEPPAICPELMECLADSPQALAHFQSLNGSHRLYFSKWIESAKTAATRTKRIAMSVNALEKKMAYNEMLRANAQAVNK
ncbi:MAG TPA: YdeI/OmpD-associated family protein [Puia sp.]|nr:YdeI/OmpD-associated family protein [Puia sp.]